jgi:glyoxylase-like metal-dependent hydrolase (beta-lactamase superfamily II)
MMKMLKAVSRHSDSNWPLRRVAEMSVSKLDKHIYLIDAETAGIKNFIASYVLKGGQVAMVETGPRSSVPNLLAGLKQLKVKPEDVAYVAVSHIHLDHAGGVGTLLNHLPNARVIVHPRGAPHLVHPEKLWEQSKMVLGSITELYGEPQPVPEDRILATSDGMVFDLGDGTSLKVVETLGHASHHQSFYELSSQGIFSGDAAGIYLSELDVIVPTTPAPFRLDVALVSLNKLMSLTPVNLFYSHFGRAPDATRKLEMYVQQLRLWGEIAKHGLEKGESAESIGKQIFERDMAVRKASEYIKVHPILGDTVFTHSVQGVVDFVQKYSSVLR